MIIYDIYNGPKQIGDKHDPDIQKIEIQEYLKDYLNNPKKESSIVDDKIYKYYDKKKSLKGKINEYEINQIVDYFVGYRKERKKARQKKAKTLENYSNTNDILKEARKEKKVIIIEAMSETCYFCKKMDKEVFSKDEIKVKMDKDFIYIKVDKDKTKLPFGLSKKYNGLTPTFFMINSNGKLVNEYPGSWTKKDFIEILNENK